MSEENQGFTISDKRVKMDDTSQSSSRENPGTSSQDSSKPERENLNQSVPDFSGFLLSLGTSALVHLGESVVPGQLNKGTNLPQAKEIIDLLSILESKTKGNLTREEGNLLSNLLYTLRMKFVELKNK